jgi:nucleoid-associated protein Lsr2
MVQRRIIELLDDLDGGRADETVEFSLDGSEYQIDLSADNAKILRATLEPYRSAARHISTGRHSLATREHPADANESHLIREWARARGLDVSPRGRIPAYLKEAYRRR